MKKRILERCLKLKPEQDSVGTQHQQSAVTLFHERLSHDAALELWPVFDAIDRLYVAPAIAQAAGKKTADRSCRMAFRLGRGILRGLSFGL